MDYCCYLIFNNETKTYIGCTNNFSRRIRQHNKEIKGGAKYTTNYKTDKDWVPVLIVEGFKDKSTALSFEWRMKKQRNSRGVLKRAIGITNRIKNVFEIIKEDKITSKSCLVSDLPLLTIKIHPDYKECCSSYIDDISTLTNISNIKIEETVFK